MRSTAWKGLWLGVFLFVGACGGGSKPPPGKACVVNSDCTNPLSCSYGICHVTCMEARDCSPGEDCIKSPVGNVCQLPSEAKCTYRNQCAPPLACALDRQCRSQCQVDIDCPTSTQKCVQPDGVCAEPVEINHTTGLLENSLGTPVPDAPPDGGTADGAVAGSGGSGASGTGGSGEATDAGAAGSGDGGVDTINRCPSPQTSFGLPGQGDSNQSFQSGVGALGPNVMYIFSSYEAPVGDGGAQQFQIYVQAFDPKTGDSKGPSQPLFEAQTLGLSPPNGKQPFVVPSAAVAPTGDIALLYYMQGVGPNGGALFAAFLSPSMAGGSADGGGVDGLTLKHVALVTAADPNRVLPNEANGVDTPNVMWSNASQTFVVHYRQYGDTLSFNKFAVGGQTAGGVSPIPTLQASTSTAATNGAVGESGNLLGVAYMGEQDFTGVVGLTVMDEGGNLVGTPLVLAKGDTNLSWASVSGTAQGFVCVYDQPGQQAAAGVFVSTSPDAGIVGSTARADAGIPTLPGFTLPGKALDLRTVADDVGQGGKGGIGVALVLDSAAVGFAYVNADGVGHQGPYQAFAHGGGQASMSMTNFNGSFVISSYTPGTNATQIVATGICP